MTFGWPQEFPNIRFRAAKPGEDASSGLEARSLVAQRVAVDLNERLSLLQRNGQLPAASSCELIIFDRQLLTVLLWHHTNFLYLLPVSMSTVAYFICACHLSDLDAVKRQPRQHLLLWHGAQ